MCSEIKISVSQLFIEVHISMNLLDAGLCYILPCMRCLTNRQGFQPPLFSSFFLSKVQKGSSRANFLGGSDGMDTTSDVRVIICNKKYIKERAKLKYFETNSLL